MYNSTKTSNTADIVSEILEQREKIAILPTPILKLENITKLLEGPNIFIKRDDNTGLALGGNKTRKLEYLIHYAKQNKNDMIITVGAPQSNHCRQTAAACAMFNIECYLVLVGEEEELSGNLLLDSLLGAQIIFIKSEEEAYAHIQNFIVENMSKGKRPLFIPAGGSNVIGINGYVNAYREIMQQEQEMNTSFDYIIFASSSYGTHAGLVIGKTIFQKESLSKLVGVSICKSFLDSKSNLTSKEKICQLTEQYRDFYNLSFSEKKEEILLDERFNELGYGNLSDDDIVALKMFAQKEGIILDPVYSGRAAGGMIKMIQNNEIPKDKNVLFLHTGGAPALFDKKFKNLLFAEKK